MPDHAEVVRRFYAAVTEGDASAIEASIHPDAKFHTRLGLVVGRVYGADELDAYLVDVAEAWEDMRLEALEVQPIDDDRVVATVRFEARARSTGAMVDQMLGVVMDFRGDQIVLMRAYASPAAAVAAIARE